MENGKIRYIWRVALAALALTLALTAPALAASDGTTTWRALLIGNSSYKDSRLDDLPSCAYDLAQMRSALTSGSVSYKKVSSLSSQTVAGLQSAVNAVATWGADEDDVTVFYYSGHGASSGLVGVDYNATTGSGIYSFQLLQSALSNVQGKVIILLDSCESGGLIGKSAKSAGGGFTDNAIAAFSGASASSKGLGAKAITSGDHFNVIASSSQTQSSLATSSGKQYGLATNALCAAMGWQHSGSSKSGNKLASLEGDLNGDLTVTLSEAYGYAAPAVAEIAESNGYVQDMQIYPSGSTQRLISRAGAREAPRATPSTTMNFPKACIAPKMTLQLQLNNPDATEISWSSSKNSIATVSASGLVTGVQYNFSTTPTIMATYKAGGVWYYATCKVRVLPARYVVQSVRLKTATLSLVQGKGYTMPVRFSPASALYKSLTWSSDHPDIVKVSSGGRILAVASSGTATITATAISGATASVVVTATPAVPTSVTLTYKTRTLIPGQTFMLTETVLPTTAADKKVTWGSSNDDVATVDDTGLVTANKDSVYGRTTISATTANGKRATCVVTVVANQSIPRTRPRSTYGQVVSSARKIYYEGGALCVDMWFYNRKGSTQVVPYPAQGEVVLKLKNVEPLPLKGTFPTVKVSSGHYILYKFRFDIEVYTEILHKDLRGSDAWYEAVN